MSKSSNITIVGSGFAGLSAARALLEKFPQAGITVYDPIAPVDRASARAFLLHPFIHPKALLNWRGFEAFAAAEHFLQFLSQRAEKAFFKKTGFLKLANDPKLVNAFEKSAQKCSALEYHAETPFGYPGIWVKNAYQIQATDYLEAFEALLKKRGVRFKNERFNESKKQDLTIYTSSYALKSAFPSTFDSFTLIKGQTLLFKMPKGLVLKHPLSAYKCHLIPSLDSKTLLLASTYERSFKSHLPDPEVATELLLDKASFLTHPPQLEDLIEVKSGVRFYAPDKLPKIGKIDNQTWFYSALGSKGVLYHIDLAYMLAEAVAKNSLDPIKEPIRFIDEG